MGDDLVLNNGSQDWFGRVVLVCPALGSTTTGTLPLCDMFTLLLVQVFAQICILPGQIIEERAAINLYETSSFSKFTAKTCTSCLDSESQSSIFLFLIALTQKDWMPICFQYIYCNLYCLRTSQPCRCTNLEVDCRLSIRELHNLLMTVLCCM